jgi:hypothetical protein
MAISKEVAKELWVSWTIAVMSSYVPETEEGEEVSPDDLAEDIVDVAAAVADLMLEEYEDRFGTAAKTRKKKKRRATDPEEEEEEEER